METFTADSLPEIAPNPDPMGLHLGDPEAGQPVRPTGGLTVPGSEIFTPEVPSIAAGQIASFAVGEQVTRPL